ncbi:MAG: GtrA family protein [Hyphomicrobiaceae bacterium]|nr:GtrA family protein [Hyphomicrobiaceae bacterium]
MQITPLARGTLDRPQGRFLIAGGIAALVNWLVRFPIELAMPYFAALLLATSIGMSCGFLLYRGWVFPGSTRSLAGQIRDFILVNLTGQATMLGIATIARQLLLVVGIGPVIAGATAHALGIGAAAIVNYLGHRHVTFTTAPPRRT